jgi:uncharacterized RDD family membrane protein YckC
MSAPNPYAAPIADVNGSPAEQVGPLASRGSRLGANLLDGLVYLGPAVVAGVGLALFAGGRQQPAGALQTGGVVLGIAGLLGFLALLIFQLYRLATTGQTLGKKWVGVRVVKLDGAPVNFSSAVMLRGLLPGLLGAVPYVGWLFALVDIFFIFRDDRRCIHDLIATTKVVEAPSE